LGARWFIFGGGRNERLRIWLYVGLTHGMRWCDGDG
jgi:hypothetical protein